ncbi:hypothetical protein [Kiloniella sp.]|uniref:hypothetical protein n=1 Tax=Kiloniella sp. TaxID=1938587 RepID=UPI003B027661
MIAAPAKFQAASLPVSTLLQIGQAQFNWLGASQWVFVILILLLVVISGRALFLILGIPVVIFMVQEWLLMPALDERTINIIAGQMIPANRLLHISFVGAEIIKCLSLIAGSLILFHTMVGRSEKPC